MEFGNSNTVADHMVEGRMVSYCVYYPVHNSLPYFHLHCDCVHTAAIFVTGSYLILVPKN
ncbi:unnamed protein product [Schistosoma curassoni]|uniref:Plastocyanin-like domain-containing protein n=1 Tax=Schistosoma curassoni TaxID=6186 RepID=A0A183JV38_9TREM|nr:unnamed protein product [Schistosoma curassoni]